MFPSFRGIPLVLRWCSVGILECSAGVPGNVQLFRHCSRVFRCSASALSGGIRVRILSGGIRVRIPQELDVVALWPWNLDVVVF